MGPIEELSSSWWPYVVLFISVFISMIRSYMGGRTYKNDAAMNGKVVIITGANSGIGFEVATDMAGRGATVVMACKDLDAGQKASTEIRKRHPNASIDVFKLDLASLQSVADFVHKLPYQIVNILINNAGIVFQPFVLTEDGFESHFQVNYLGHFLLTRLLVPKMCAVPGARIINMTSQAHFASDVCLHDLNLQINYSAKRAFGQSKLCLVLMTQYLGHKLKDTNVNVLAVNPGLVRGTKHVSSSPVLQESILLRLAMLPLMWLFMKTPNQGAQSVLYAALDSNLKSAHGAYILDCKVSKPSPLSEDEKLAEALFERSLNLVGAKTYPGSTVNSKAN